MRGLAEIRYGGARDGATSRERAIPGTPQARWVATSEQLPAELATWPAWTPGEEQLGELELITSGAFAPLTGYLTAADLAAVSARGQLADGTPWPVPVTLTVPAGAVPADAGRLVLQDPEGSPLAVVEITERVAARADGTALRLAGPVTALRPPEHGPFRALRRDARRGPRRARRPRPPCSRTHQAAARPAADRPAAAPGRPAARHASCCCRWSPARPSWSPGRRHWSAPSSRRPGSFPRARWSFPCRCRRAPTPAEELLARAVVAAAYGATHLLAERRPGDRASRTPFGCRLNLIFPSSASKILAEGEWAYDPSAEVWRPLGLIEPGMERGELSDGELGELLDSGSEVPAWLMPAGVAEELRRARPPRARRGVVVFFTGLSGSGKSTLARDLRDALLERGDRTVSLLDGDLVRRLLSAGLTFSREDRDLNIARIGYVAAEVARHGGIAICAPIAPYAAARAGVRQMVSEVGDFVLVHVSTPLEVCEARDRKGLYAQARAGIIGSFTGISDPYEEPDDADLVIDTSAVSRHDAVAAVLAYLTRGGWLA